MSAERECERLVLRFAEAVDNGRYEELAELCTQDAVFFRPAEPNNPIRGVQAIIDSYRVRLAAHVSLHLCTNILITPESDSKAAGVTRILFFAAARDAISETGKGRRAEMQLVGRFADRFEKTAQGWRFAERRGEMLFHV